MKWATSRPSAFTIIETVLFLGLTSLMILGILITTGRSVDIQRYRDAVDSLQSKIQEQYSITANPENYINGQYSCNNAVITMGGNGYKGQSNCVIIGRYLTVGDANSSSIDIYPVIGNDVSFPTGTTDLNALQNANLTVATSQKETYSIEWSSSMKTQAKLPIAFSILIARSPVSSNIMTFVSSSSNASLSSNNSTYFINSAGLSQPLIICLDSGGVLSGNTMGVRVDANAANSSAIEMIGDATSVANGGCT